MPENAATSEFPRRGALLGIDFGSKRVGLALSTPDQTIASPLEILPRSRPAQEAQALCKFCKDYRVVGLVVGLPVHMSGEEGEKAKQAREYGQWCAAATGLPVCFWDERFTSSMADNHLRLANVRPNKRQAHLDKLAAQVMLQSFLETEDRSAPPSALPRRSLE